MIRTNEELAAAFAQWLRVLNLSKTVLYSYPHMVEKFAASLSGRAMLDATRDDVRAFGASFASVAMRAQAIYALRAFYDFLNLGGLTRRNPAREVCVPKRPPPRIRFIPTPEQMCKFLEGIGRHDDGEEA
jgi:site-specific recombinase XerD